MTLLQNRPVNPVEHGSDRVIRKVHDIRPAFHRYTLKNGEHRENYVVEVGYPEVWPFAPRSAVVPFGADERAGTFCVIVRYCDPIFVSV